MREFVFELPTKICFGKGVEAKVGEEVKARGAKKVLVHYGGGSAMRSGLLDRVTKSLEDAGITYVALGGVAPNPRLSLVREGIVLARREQADLVLAVGGGSVIDSSKAIALGIHYPGDIWDCFMNKGPAPTSCVPVGVVLTIAAAGSETSDSMVITNEEGSYKRAYASEMIVPRFAFMNPALTTTLPAYQTACGVVDILIHTLERYFSRDKQTALTDRIAEGLLVTVMEQGRILLHSPCDYDARAEIMWAGSLSHNGLTGVGKRGDWGSHRVEHELSAMFGVAHGAGLAAVWGSWARFVYKTDIPRFAQFAVRVMGVPMDFEDMEKTALAGIAALEGYFRALGLPTSIPALVGEVSDAQIDEMAKKCMILGPVGSFVPLHEEEVRQILKMARDIFTHMAKPCG